MSPLGLRYKLLAPLILLVSLGVTYWLWHHEQRNALIDRLETADYNLREATGSIDQRIATYEQVLRGVQGLFAASDQVRREEFKTYLDSLQLGADYAGLEGIGFVQWTARADLPALIADQRQSGIADYQVRPEGERDFYAPVVQMELLSGNSHLVLGIDPYADAERRVAMERARDSGDAKITGKVELVIPGETDAQSKAGFLMFLPVYAKGRPHETQAERQAALIGWVVAPLRINKLMASLYGTRSSAMPIRIYEGVKQAKPSLLYDSSQGTARSASGRSDAVEYLEVAGRTWTLEILGDQSRERPISKDNSGLIAGAGLALSLLLTVLTWVLTTGHSRAHALAREMTRELRDSETRLRHQAEHDALTGLPNRALFSDHLSHALAQARRNRSRLALMFIDLDRFKPINDTLGHHVGDALLQVVAERLQSCVRESDIVGRMGGDEFVVLLPVIDGDEDALVVAEKIRDALNQPFDLGCGQPLSLSSSTGIALFPEHGQDEVQLTKNADAAMYLAKDNGRNQVQLYRAVMNVLS
ncbi:MAG: CHASE domain-containing protein [Pseudomonas sp.]|uniref:CHASE domain-containing protein n=1 Tax=Pseudomonas sp. TaxID=306 RepID=UPI0030F03166